MADIGRAGVNNYALELKLVVLLGVTMQGEFFKLFGLILIVLQGLQVLYSQLFSELESFLGVGFKVQFIREVQSGVNFGVHEDVIVEDYPLKVDEEDVRNFIQYIPFGCVRPPLTRLAQAVAYELASMHALQSRMQVVLSFNLNTVGEKLLDPLPFCPAIMADHLSNLVSLEQLRQDIFEGCALQGSLYLVE